MQAMPDDSAQFPPARPTPNHCQLRAAAVEPRLSLVTLTPRDSWIYTRDSLAKRLQSRLLETHDESLDGKEGLGRAVTRYAEVLVRAPLALAHVGVEAQAVLVQVAEHVAANATAARV